jgi:predicted ATPase
MAIIEGIRIRNFKALKDITMGKLWNMQKAKPLTPMTVVIGKNGVGKSTLFDAFGFLSDCLKYGVEEACDTNGRRGFDNIRTHGQSEPIEFVVYYRQNKKSRPITYELAVDKDKSERPFVLYERLRQRRRGQTRGRPFTFLILNSGKGLVWKGDSDGQLIEEETVKQLDLSSLLKQAQQEETNETDTVELSDNRKLGIATLGALKQHPRISEFRKFIEDWYLSYFTPDAARGLPLSGAQKHLNIHGDNLANVVQYMEREHSKRFQVILNRIAEKIPGIEKIDTEKTSDGRLLLRFNDRGYKDPFYAQQMSDGTLKVFAYLLLLEDPTPPPFICIEEPENGLYHKLLESLAQEFREHAHKGLKSSQLFVTTHQPYFVDALEPDEVWILEKEKDGYSTIKRVSEIDIVKNMVEEGLPLGSLWYSDYLDERS